jgi:putative ABC transport system substrate-binding protein
MQFGRLKRRELITLLGGAATWPLAARAQQSVMLTIGCLYVGSPEAYTGRLAAFRKGLDEIGYVEGRDVAIEYRWAHNDTARLPGLAAELVKRPVTVIAAGDLPSALAAKAASTTIPIVFETAADPVRVGLVASLNRPGANVTGVTNIGAEIGAKRVGLLHELLPGAVRFAALVNLSNPLLAEASIKETQSAAAAIGRQLEILTASTDREIDSAFTSVAQKQVEALLVLPDNLFSSRRVQLVIQAARHGVPAIYSNRDHAEAGGLMSYGANITDAYRQAGVYVGRVLKGEKPANMPVLQPTKLEFVINMQTARAFGITVPPTLLAIADEVIE